jgi:DNA-directed RNA polymerase specialized sigma24 family protein
MRTKDAANGGIGLTHAEIGERLGIPSWRVQYLERRAIRKMKKLALELGLRLDDGPSESP